MSVVSFVELNEAQVSRLTDALRYVTAAAAAASNDLISIQTDAACGCETLAMLAIITVPQQRIACHCR